MALVADADMRAAVALDGGNLLLAYDIAISALNRAPAAPGLLHKRILALARTGDTQRALAELDATKLSVEADEEWAGLRARLLKDLALSAPASEQRERLIAARDGYVRAYERGAGYYSGINAATISLLAGEHRKGHEWARLVLADQRVAEAADYWSAATAAEALLLLDRRADATAALVRALSLPAASASARASTLRQFELIAEHSGKPDLMTGLLNLLRPPPVLVFSGHLFRADEAVEKSLTGRIEAALDCEMVLAAYGALAAGADVLFAEAVLRRNIELQIVLPFAMKDFMEQLVAPMGTEWLPRVERVLAAAHGVTCASDAAFAGCAAQFVYGNDVMLGLACLRASYLSTTPTLMAVWDKKGARGSGGAADGIETWQDAGRRAIILELGEIDRKRETTASPQRTSAIARECRSFIFTDYAGFSRLDENALPIFWTEVMARVGAVLEQHSDKLLFRNTWGDAVYAVVADPFSAAAIALELVERLAELDHVSTLLPPGLGIRAALHHGPVYRATDPVTGKLGYFGTEVTRTARIEPVTPVGAVYVTQSFAATFGLANASQFRTSYVGVVPLAKGYGTLAMHRLERVVHP